MDLSALAEYCSANGLVLSSGQAEAFERFGEALYEDNKVMNLTRVPYDQCGLRHFVDSILVQEFVAQGATVLDIGSGPGFPAWPLALLRPDVQVTALDGSAKALGFLRKHPLPNLHVVQGRAEEWRSRHGFDVVTGRALAPFPAQAEVSLPLVKIGGVFVPLRTSHDLSEIQSFPFDRLGAALESVATREWPGLDGQRCFPIVRKLSMTPKQYPRRWPEIKSKPITGQKQGTPN